VSLKLQLISTDFDGTVHDDLAEPPMPVELQERIALLQHAGAKWVINTGRDLPSLLATLDQARLRVQPDYLVVVERDIYARANGEYLESQPWNQRCRQAHRALFAQVVPRVPEINSWIRSRFQASLFADAYSPFCLVAASNQDADAIMTYLEGVCQEIPGLMVMRNDIYARFNHADFNKGTAMAEIARIEGIHRSRIFAAGDHLNDLPMLSSDYARYLMAPANAVAQVKQAVQKQNGYLSLSSHGHGVLEALEHYSSSETQGDEARTSSVS
jgi:hydroxymethylpyrimidine pyrophosphatase-like HAD family hydrolase